MGPIEHKLAFRELTSEELIFVSGGDGELEFAMINSDGGGGDGGDSCPADTLCGTVTDDSPATGSTSSGELTPGEMAVAIAAVATLTVVTGGIAVPLLVGAELVVEATAVGSAAAATGAALGLASATIAITTPAKAKAQPAGRR